MDQSDILSLILTTPVTAHIVKSRLYASKSGRLYCKMLQVFPTPVQTSVVDYGLSPKMYMG